MGLGLAYAGSQKEEVRVVICLFIEAWFNLQFLPFVPTLSGLQYEYVGTWGNVLNICSLLLLWTMHHPSRIGYKSLLQIDGPFLLTPPTMLNMVQVLDLLTPIVQDSKVGIEVAGFAAIALGLIYVGSCNEDVAQSIVLALMERSEAELGEPLARFLCLGLGLLYLGKQVQVPTIMIYLLLCFDSWMRLSRVWMTWLSGSITS